MRLFRLLRNIGMFGIWALVLTACSTDVKQELPVIGNKEVCYVASFGKPTVSRTLYTEQINVESQRPYLTGKWGGTEAVTETISLYDANGVLCGHLKAIIEAGGAENASFSGIINDEMEPSVAYYARNTEITDLKTKLDLTEQKQSVSGSTAHLGGLNFMKGTLSDESRSITFRQTTAVIKYILGLEKEESETLQADLLSLKQVEGGSALSLVSSFDGSVTEKVSVSNLLLGSQEQPMSIHEKLEAYTTIFPFEVKDKKFSVFVRTTTGLYESQSFAMNQDVNSGVLYTLDLSVPRLKQYDWYFNPEVLKDKDGKDSLVYKVSSADELEALAKIVNGDAGLKEADDFEGKTIEMTKDIDLKDKQPWTPIGDGQENAFSGKFNGGGNSISNMVCNGDGAQGLFGFLDGASIQNLTVNGEVSGSGDYTGGIAGYAQDSSFENVSMNGNVSGEGDYTGGLVGYTENCIIKDCEFGAPGCNFTIKGLDWVGGLVGYSRYGSMWGCSNYGGVQGLYPKSPGGSGGGIVGGCEEGKIYISQNFGNVDYFLNSGGIAGSMNSGVVTGCTNYGGVSLSGMLGNLIYNIAGIVGKMDNTDINGCYSNGEIGGNGAGIAWGTGDIEGSYYEDGAAGNGGAYTDELTDEERDAMNDLLKDLGYGYNEEGVVEPLDKSNGNVDNFGGGGKLE